MATENIGAMSDAELYDVIAQEYGFEKDADEAIQPETPESAPEQDSEGVPPKEDEVAEDVPEQAEEKEPEDKWFPESIDQLAEALEVDLDALKAIKIKTKVDGVESDVPLGEVIKNYQINKSLTERSEQLAHNRKVLEQAAQEFQQQRDNQLAQWQTWNQVLETRLREQVAAVDWQQLREEDPAEYAAKRQEFTERIAEVEHMKRQFSEQQQQAAYQSAVQRQQQFQKIVEENIKALPNIIPEYTDSEKMKAEMTELQTYLGKLFRPEEVNSVYDARHIAIARKAMLYDKMTDKAAPKLDKLSEKPKFVKPAARQSKELADRTALRDKYKRAMKTQSTDDWVSVIADRI
jgi:hypothetical protein